MTVTNSCTITICSSVCTLVFPVQNNSGVTPAGECGTWVKESDGGYFTSPNYPEKYPPERECVYIIEGEASILLSLASHSVFTSSVSLSPRLDLFPSSSLSQTVHRLILRWQVLNRAILGVQVRPHRGPRRALWFLASHRSLLWAGKPRICPLQWEVPVHQVCGWWWTGGHWFLCPV